MQPRQVFKSSNDVCHFTCDQCFHKFDMMPASVTKGCWCPYCCYPPKKLCENINCQLCFENSFASHPKAQYWSDQNEKTPRQTFKCSGLKCWFVCEKCSHHFESVLASVYNGSWCPFCSSQKLCDDPQCQLCFKHSFVSQPKIRYWSDQNVEVPRQVFKNSNKRYYFMCEMCPNVSKKRPNDVSRYGSCCPACTTKTENKLYVYLNKYYPSVQRQFKPEWCRKFKYQSTFFI